MTYARTTHPVQGEAARRSMTVKNQQPEIPQVSGDWTDRGATDPVSVAATDRKPNRWAVLAVVGVAQLMVVLDATIVTIAIPSAQKALGFSTDSRQWIVTAYALSFGSLLLLGGKLTDLFGRKWTLIAGLVGFSVASSTTISCATPTTTSTAHRFGSRSAEATDTGSVASRSARPPMTSAIPRDGKPLISIASGGVALFGVAQGGRLIPALEPPVAGA